MKRINLIPPEAEKITPNKWLKFYLFKSRTTYFIALAIVVFVFINIWQATALLRYKFAIRQSKKSIAGLQAKLISSQDTYAKTKHQREAMEKDIKFIEEKLKFIQEAQREKIVFAGTLTYLSTLIPQDLWVNKITLDKELITIDGTTFNNAIISHFMAKLDESDYFRNTSFNYTQKGKLTDKSVIDFEITTHIMLEKIIK